MCYNKEIYEGDIVQFFKGYADDSWLDTAQGKPFEVKWIEDECRFMAIRKPSKYAGAQKLVPGTEDPQAKYGMKWEVIGNVFENPELLER